MCGIAGLFNLREAAPIDRELLVRMTDRIRHRGPDDDGFHVEPGVGLGHRRLSIIDLSGGHQPIGNEDGSVVVVFNGEIYNFQELARELAAAGHSFRTRSDTEVIVHAWEEWGARCVERFSGMFAFALWDRKRQTLFLARDRLGKKPLYYALLPSGELSFASELKALCVDPRLPRSIDPCAVEDYLTFGYIPDPRTIYRGVHKLPPAHVLVVRRGAPLPAPSEYWDVEFAPRAGMSEARAADELVQQLKGAVERRLIAEVPLGAFLSGGVDSSAVVAQMAQLSATPVKTCSIAFRDPRFNEAPYAELMARRYGTDHVVEEVDTDDFGLLDTLVDVYDEPFADSSALPTYRVCEMARRHVTVALSGDAGDENFAGYRRYKWHAYEERMRAWLPAGLRRPLFGLAGHIYPKLDWAPRVLRAKSTLQSIARTSMDGYLHSVSFVDDATRSALYGASFRRELQGYTAAEVFRRHAARAPRHDPLAFVQYLDFKTYLPGDILTKVDRASMAHGLEVRVPMLDHTLVEWAATLPSELKLRNGEGKYILKRAMRDYLPREVLHRPKMGFAVPLASWFRGPLRERLGRTLLDRDFLEGGLFEPRTIRRLLDEHWRGRRDHGPTLWALMMYAGFQKRLGVVERKAA